MRYIELSKTISAELRKDLLKDLGVPRLQTKCLALISAMRLEQQ